MGHQLILTIKPDGSMTSEVKGVSGPKCTDITKFLDQLGNVVEDKHTEDYYKQDGQGVTVNQ